MIYSYSIIKNCFCTADQRNDDHYVIPDEDLLAGLPLIELRFWILDHEKATIVVHCPRCSQRKSNDELFKKKKKKKRKTLF